MPEQSTESHLSPAERESLDNRALRQHARAINELSRLAVHTGMSDGQVEAGVVAIRALDKADAKKAYRGFMKANVMLSQLVNVKSETINEVAVDDAPVAEVVVPDEILATISEPELMPQSESPSELIFEEVQTPEVNNEDALSERGLKFVTDIFGEGSAERLRLTTDDLERIADVALDLRAGHYDRSVYRVRTLAMLRGLSDTEIGKTTGANQGTISMTFSRLNAGIRSTDGYSIESAYDLLAQAIGRVREEDPAKEDSAVESIVESEPQVLPLDTVPDEPEIDIDDNDDLAILRNAIRGDVSFDRSAWLAAGEEYLKTTMAPPVDEYDAGKLWQAIHFNDQERSADFAASLDTALDTLKPAYFAFKDKLFGDGSFEDTALRLLLIKQKQYNTVEDIFNTLHRRDATLTEDMTERRLVAAVAELINAR